MRGQKYFSVALASVISTGDPKTVSVQTGKFLRLPFSGQLQRERKSRSKSANQPKFSTSLKIFRSFDDIFNIMGKSI